MKTETENTLHHYMQLWNLLYDGDGFCTHCSFIQPVLSGDAKCILKIPFSIEEKRGGKVLEWWHGVGAVKVLALDGDAILMERITGDCSLKSMSLNAQDDEATEIICAAADILHSNKREPLPELTPLEIWFEELFSSAERYGDAFIKSAVTAKRLLENQSDIRVLHGDLHHDNILYSQERGWLAIDPKGLVGERAFDYVNILCNPTEEIALSEGRLMRQIYIISKNTGIAVKHLLEWTVAWAGLSAVWFLNDDLDATTPSGVLEIALAHLHL